MKYFMLISVVFLTACDLGSKSEVGRLGCITPENSLSQNSADCETDTGDNPVEPIAFEEVVVPTPPADAHDVDHQPVACTEGAQEVIESSTTPSCTFSNIFCDTPILSGAIGCKEVDLNLAYDGDVSSSAVCSTKLGVGLFDLLGDQSIEYKMDFVGDGPTDGVAGFRACLNTGVDLNLISGFTVKVALYNNGRKTQQKTFRRRQVVNLMSEGCGLFAIPDVKVPYNQARIKVTGNIVSAKAAVDLQVDEFCTNAIDPLLK